MLNRISYGAISKTTLPKSKSNINPVKTLPSKGFAPTKKQTFAEMIDSIDKLMTQNVKEKKIYKYVKDCLKNISFCRAESGGGCN